MKQIVAAAGLLLLLACGGSSGPTAPSPTPTPTPTPTATWSLSGTVLDRGSSAPLRGATVEILDGPTTRCTTTCSVSGTYRFDGLQAGTTTVRASQSGYATETRSVTLTSPQTLDIALSAAAVTTGQTVDGLTGAAASGITVRLASGGEATTGADGTFQLGAATEGQQSVTVFGPAFVDRQTGIRVPGPNPVIQMIPSTFDLATFDQMCRAAAPGLRRWQAAPGLVVIDAVLQFTTVSANSHVARSERLTPAERDRLVADLTWGLPQVTGGAFTAFQSVTTESPEVGATVQFFTRENSIVVARFKGLTAGSGYWGYGRWAARGYGVVAGAVMVDRDFDAGTSSYVRSLRVHEMGHALGYEHVTLRASFMNSSAVYEPLDFDRDATRLAFQRPPGNRSPDRDPDGFSTNLRGQALPLVWGPITP